EGAHSFGDIGPQIQALEQGKVQLDMFNNSLAPASFYPIYRVTPKTNL
ncbi:TMAO reductase system protein TorT, partial [Shewanella sp. SR41-2]|nr:TMAO reductase system protein TorT [Shewanella sp. SR41-2]